jgi:mRNA interferase RelE/StbE
MAYKIVFHLKAIDDLNVLDLSVKKDVSKKIHSLSENLLLGKPLGNKIGLDLTGCYKLYAYKKRYRIVYRLIGEYIEVIEIIAIGKRDKENVYITAANRIQ